MDKVLLTGDNGDTIELFIIESTRLGAVDYVLASDVEQGDGECYILKDTAAAESEESVYQIVEDEHELDYIANVFAELIEGADIAF